MSKFSETLLVDPKFKLLNPDDKRLIAEIAGYHPRYVDMVLRGIRKNEKIINLASSLVDKKKEIKSDLIKEKYREDMVEPHLNIV